MDIIELVGEYTALEDGITAIERGIEKQPLESLRLTLLNLRLKITSTSASLYRNLN